MQKFDSNSLNFKKRSFGGDVTRAVRRFSRERRNAIRGAIAYAERRDVTVKQVDEIRQNLHAEDMYAAAQILESPNGLKQRQVYAVDADKVTMTSATKATSSDLEAVYASAFLNSWRAETLEAIEAVRSLSGLGDPELSNLADRALQVSKKWGASNYLARKIAHLKDFCSLTNESEAVIADIDRTLRHAEHPMLQYSAFENVKERVSLFSVARRHTNIFQDDVDGNYRSVHYLNNLVSTPFSIADASAFLLRSVETALIDTVYSLIIIYNLSDRFEVLRQIFDDNLHPEILLHINELVLDLARDTPPSLVEAEEAFLASSQQDEDPEDRSLSLYRRSSAFLEWPTYCRFRNDIDRVIGIRLVAPVIAEIREWPCPSFDSAETLIRTDAAFRLDSHFTSSPTVDTFYRTYLFLKFIQDRNNLAALTAKQIRFVFNGTMRLDSLLLESELRTMHLNAPKEAQALLSVLALSLHRTKSSDPDVDFDFREQLENFIYESFGGNISAFITEIAPESPDVANYITASLDEATLQKMYSIVSSPSDADAIRKDILTTVGTQLNKIEYIIEAESIETRAKVAKLKDYFDASRMFVDSLAMKRWLISNPSAVTEQYKELLPRITARLSRDKVLMVNGEEAKIDIYELSRTDEYLVEQMAKDAFSAFCANNEFGIESYLGRRIRHNTLNGVMTKTVDAVVKNPNYTPVIAGTPFGRALATWQSNYKTFIERMRREFLQFREDGKPNALFDAKLNVEDAATSRGLSSLVHTLRISGSEMLHDLIITFCWQQIAPQLENASREIRVNMAQDMIQNLEHTLQRFNGPEEVKIRSELAEAVSSVFSRVASWFQTPQTGFVPASIPEICNIIDIEHHRSASATLVSGNFLQTKYYGISVHRIYDCLAVLLQNAFKHGQPGSGVKVSVYSEPVSGTSLHTIDISVISKLPTTGAANCVRRVQQAIDSTETGRDMVTEGYSGLKKVKFITRLNEGRPTVTARTNDNSIAISFQIKAEVTASTGGDNAASLG